MSKRKKIQYTDGTHEWINDYKELVTEIEESKKDKILPKMDFTHPCKGTCSGYNQDCKQTIQNLELKLNLAIETLKFYADKENYAEDFRAKKLASECHSIVRCNIKNDCEDLKEDLAIAGYLARKTLKEIGEL